MAGFLLFLGKLAAVVLIIRSFVFAPFSIPSESMLPRLIKGDHLIASKWNYGFSNASLPFGLRLFPAGRIFARQPDRGDVVIFKHPLTGEDYIKRVIGLPGEHIQMRGGVVFINGKAVRKERIADFEVAISANTGCEHGIVSSGGNGSAVCRYARYREILPNGVRYDVLDFGPRQGDDTRDYLVPPGHLFLMGDNRDNSRDSRWPATPHDAVGMVSQENLVGRARVMMWSTDGSAEWLRPWTWFTAARWSRIGGAI